MEDDIMQGLDDSSLAAKLANPQPKPRAQAPDEPLVKSAVEVSKQDDITLTEWFKGFSGANIKIKLERKAPEIWRGKQIAGMIDVFEELIDETFIKENYGGGRYQLLAQKQTPSGKYVYAGARTIKIAGDPKLSGTHFDMDLENKKDDMILDDNVTRQAMSMTERLTQEALARAERAESELRSGPKGLDPVMISVLTKPFEMQVQTLQSLLAEKDRIIAEKDKTIHDLSSRKPDTVLQDTLITKMYDGESAKIEQLRTQFESERRMLLETHREELKRVENRWDIDKSNLVEAHRRELKALEHSYESQIKAQEIARQGVLDAKDNRIKDLERLLNRSESELGELRAKKDKTLVDQMSEMAQIRATMSEFFGENKEEEEPSTAEKIIGALADNPIVRGLGERLASGQPIQAQPQPKRRQIQAPREEAPVPTPSLPGVSAGEIAQAVTFMESSIQNGTPPQTFAQSVKGMLPSVILDTLKSKGVDYFLDEVAKVSVDSPLSAQVGRSWARSVARFLTVGEDDTQAN